MKKLILTFLVFILFLQIGFVNSGEEVIVYSELSSIGDQFNGIPDSIIVEGVEISKIEGENARLDFTKSGASVDIKGNKFENMKSQSEAELPSFMELNENGEVAKAEFTVNEKGGTYRFGDTEIVAPPNSRVLFDEKTGITIKVKDFSDFDQEPYDLGTNMQNYPVTIEGSKISLSNRVIVDGKIHYFEDQAFVKLDEQTKINGVELTSNVEKYTKIGEEVNVFFDGRKCIVDCASFDIKNKRLMISSETNKNFIANFRPGNNLMQVDLGDFVAMKPLPGGEIEIQNRDSRNLIPKVITKGDFVIGQDGKQIRMDNGKLELRKISRPIMSDRDFISYKSSIGATTSPIELINLNQDGKALFGGDKAFVDNANRFAFFVPKESESFELLDEGVNTKFSSRLNYNYPLKENIEALTGKKIIVSQNLLKNNRDLIFSRIRDNWETLTPETKNSISRMHFLNKQEFEDAYGFWGDPSSASAFVKSNSGQMFFRASGEYSEHSMSPGTFFHEAAHTHQYGLKLTESSEFEELSDNLLRVKRNSEVFEEKWLNVVNENIPFYEPAYVGSFAEKYNMEPFKGYVRGYGTTNIFEDVATFVQKSNDPDFFEEILNPENEEYNPAYEKKLELLRDYGFISDEQYRKIWSAVALQ